MLRQLGNKIEEVFGVAVAQPGDHHQPCNQGQNGADGCQLQEDGRYRPEDEGDPAEPAEQQNDEGRSVHPESAPLDREKETEA